MIDLKNTRRILLAVILAAQGLPPRAALADDGGNVLPPQAKPHGYSLTDMASEIALFSTSGNSSQYYPDTPFQVLAEDVSTIVATPVNGGIVVTATNSFTVSAGTPFFVAVYYSDDSPPFTPPFPTDNREAAKYLHDVNGVDVLGIIVDGKSTFLGPDYVAGPVLTPPLLDGGGTHLISVGAFLTPLSVGKHTVSIMGFLSGPSFSAANGGLSFELAVFTYTVDVVAGH
jgi:hypothetical protein